jgi:hypothetical protein
MKRYVETYFVVRGGLETYQFLWIVDFHQDRTNEGIREIPDVCEYCIEIGEISDIFRI